MTYVYLFGGILVVLLAVVIGAALRERGGADADEAPLEARRDAALEALREVEFEFRTGKLPEDEYRALRRKYGRRALEARAALGDPCPRCGAALPPEDRFCSRCGAERPRKGSG